MQYMQMICNSQDINTVLCLREK